MAFKSKIPLLGDLEKWCLGAAFGIIFLVKLVDGEPAPPGSRRSTRPSGGVALGSLEPLPDPARPLFPTEQKRIETLSEELLENGFSLPPDAAQRFGFSSEEELYFQKVANRLAARLGKDGAKSPNLQPVVRDFQIAFDQTDRIFKSLGPKKGESPALADLLKDEKLAAKAFADIELNFGIPREDAQVFAREHDWATLADWAAFVEKRMK